MRLPLISLVLASSALAQNPVAVTPYQVIDTRSGTAVACASCPIYTYTAGTTTPQSTYTDYTLATSNTNPVLTNSAGYAVNGSAITGIWVGSSCYKFVLKDSSSITIWSQDYICDQAQVLKSLLPTRAASVGYNLGVTGSQTTTVATKLNSFYEAVADFGADPTGTTNSTAIQAGVTAANAAGVCLHTVGSTTTFNTQIPGGFIPFYQINGTITVPPGTCIRNDPNTTFEQQNLTADVFDFTGSFSSFYSGNITWASGGATAGCGISIADTATLEANQNLIRDTQLINVVASGTAGTGICLSAANLGAYQNHLQNIQARGFHTGVSEIGSSGSIVVGESQISGWLSNNTYGAYLTYVNDSPVDVWIDGNSTAGVYENYATGVTVSILGGESTGKTVYYGTAANDNICYDRSRVGACSQYVSDNSGGLNQAIGDMQQFSTTTWTDGTRFCFGICYSTTNFPNIAGPFAYFTINPPSSPSAVTSNLLRIYRITQPTTYVTDYLRFNPYLYNASTNPGGGVGLQVRLENANTSGAVATWDGGAGQTTSTTQNWNVDGTLAGTHALTVTDVGNSSRTGFTFGSQNPSGTLGPAVILDGDGGLWPQRAIAATLLGSNNTYACSSSFNRYKIVVVTGSNTTTPYATIGSGGSNVVVGFCNGSNWVVI